MSTRITFALALIGLGTWVVLIALWLLVPTSAYAQCGDIESSCYKCHQATHPVCGKSEWHSEYGHRYACWNCHGGNDKAQDKELAHVSLVRHPLEEAYTSCYPCHAENYRELAERFAKTLSVTVSAREPTPRPAVSNAPVVTQPTVTPPIVEPTDSSDLCNWAWLLWLSPVPVVLVLIWLVLTRRNS